MIHGALDHAELATLGLQSDSMCDFSSNINPFGPPESVRTAVANVDLASYPDRSCYQIRLALAEHHCCDPAHLLVGNGSNELIHLIARALINPGNTALVVEPTFGEYAHATRLAGGMVVSQSFPDHIETLCKAIKRYQPRLVWVCMPNNPTGQTVPMEEVAALAEVCTMCDSLLVLDRTYHAFARDADPLHDPLDQLALPQVLRLHSLTKSYALAGVRLGYLHAEPALIKRIGVYQPTWSVNSIAQVAAIAALADQTFLHDTIPLVWQGSDYIVKEMTNLALPIVRNDMPFMLVKAGNGAQVRMSLLQRGFAVRDCASFGLPEYVRIAPQCPENNQRLIGAWQALLTYSEK
ncbi:MAG: histidinol-phosphate aminotransferase family protein [Chloroflexi bacterium AL-W]|nr:histidinol-phosphate aminotransferase family protein [Chloroflexi bacterium AL-W]